MPPATMDAFRDHGVVRPTLTEDVEGARSALAEVERLGLDLNKVTTDLVADGVKKFSEAFDELLGAVAGKRAAFMGDRLNGQSMKLPAALEKARDEVMTRAADGGLDPSSVAQGRHPVDRQGRSPVARLAGGGRGRGRGAFRAPGSA